MQTMNGKTTPQDTWFEWQQSVLHEQCTFWRRLARLPGLYEKSKELTKGATPSDVIYQNGNLRLLRYRGKAAPRQSIPLLFVFALVNRPYILDLKTGRSVVSHFVEQGFDTYLLDWGAPGQAERWLTLNDYINGSMLDVVNTIRKQTGAARVNLLGYCMGGTMSAIFTALHQEVVQNLILLAAGIEFAKCDGLLNLWTRPEYFDVDKFVDAFGNCPAELLQASFLWLKPVQNFLEKPINLFERIEDDAFVEDFLTMELWLNDNIAVPGEVFREFVKGLYQQNLLVQNRLIVGGEVADLRRITCPVLNIMGESDDLVPCGQSLPFNDLVSSTDRKSIVFPSGHIGLAVGSKAQAQLWPEACGWLADHGPQL